MSAIEIRQLSGGSTTVDDSALAELDRRIDGEILLPPGPAWNAATLAWNGMVARTPALVVRPSSAGDVSAAVRFARDRNLIVSIRGGGHNIAGTAVAEGGITIDMGRMRSVTVDPDNRVVDVGPGCILGDVDQATQAHGLATVLGFVSETGVAGLTLGGGWGYLTRRFGWTVDNLREVEIVTADGDVRVAGANDHADLFWAIRGGSGNFGVVTRFSYELHPVGPMVTGGLVAWSAERSDEILDRYLEITSSAPRELTVAALVRLAPPAPFVPQSWHGKAVVAMLVCYSGDDPDAALGPIRAIGNPIANTVQSMPYTALQAMLNALEPKAFHRYWKTEFLPSLSPAFLQAFRDGALKVTSPLSQSVIFHLGGALNDRADDDGAVGNRDAHFITGFSGTWMPGTPAEPHVAWVRQSWDAIRDHSTGGNYVNFQLDDDDDERLEAAYRDNFSRLRRVKATYDPDNFFRANRNISPAT